jgi:hypothetical protein
MFLFARLFGCFFLFARLFGCSFLFARFLFVRLFPASPKAQNQGYLRLVHQAGLCAFFLCLFTSQ